MTALQDALAQIKQATITPDQWLAKVRGYRGYTTEQLHATAHYKAHIALWNAAHMPPPPPPPPPTALAGMAQNVMFTAWNPHAGLRAPVKYKQAITADVHVACSPEDSPEVREQKAAAFTAAAKQAAQQQHDRHGLVTCWGNQEQIGTQQIQTFGAVLSADYLIFQAETPAEYASAVAAVKAGITKVIIGNPNAWTQTQRDEATLLINAGKFVLIFEVYTNEGAPWPDQASSAGVPAAAESLGVGWGANPSLQLPDYQPHTAPAVWAGISPYLAEGFTDASWSVLP